MRSILALLLLGVAACSSDNFASTVDADTDSSAPDVGTDGPIPDAGSKGFCEQQAAGYALCDDFDTTGDGATGINSAWVPSISGKGTAARVNTLFLSSHYGLETTTAGGSSSGSLYRNPNVAHANKFSLSFAANIDPGCVEAGSGVALPTVVGFAGQSTYFLVLAMNKNLVAFSEVQSTPDPDGGAATKTANNILGTAPWPTGAWVRVVFDVDFATKQGTLRLDGKVVETPALATASVGGLTFPGVALGTSTEAPRVSGCRITYDNVVFRINGQ